MCSNLVRADVMDTYGVINSRALREVVKGSCDNRLRIALKSCGASHEAILHHLHAGMCVRVLWFGLHVV